MKYKVIAKKLMSGSYLVRCHSGPRGNIETQAKTLDDALKQMKRKIHYQLELCPCSSVAKEVIELDVRRVNHHHGELPS